MVLRGVDASKLDLSGTRMREIDATDADLRGTDLRRCDLSYARLQGAKLAGANLRGATVEAINWTTVDLIDVLIDMPQGLAVAMSYGALIDFPEES